MGGIILIWLTGWGALLLSQFQVGRVLAERSPGRELAPCVATTLLGLAIAFPIIFGSSRAEFPTGQRITEVMYGSSPAISALSQIPLLLALLAGAARVRRQRHAISS